jgi:hypothetical protein
MSDVGASHCCPLLGQNLTLSLDTVTAIRTQSNLAVFKSPILDVVFKVSFIEISPIESVKLSTVVGQTIL